MNRPQVLVNGREDNRVPVLDRGLHYGDGLFETLAVCRGEPLLWERHRQRLARGCARLGLPAPDPERLRREARTLCRGRERGVLKILLTRGQASRGYACEPDTAPTRVLLWSEWPAHPAGCREQGVAVRWCETRLSRNRRLAGIKHLNRLEQVLARAEWEGEYAEGLMRDDQGQVIEGVMSNVFLVRNGELHTPDLSECGIEGVMRALVMERAARHGLAVSVGALTREDFLRAEEVFLTNSLIGVWPVRQIENTILSMGPVSRRVMEWVQDGCCG